MSLKTTILMAVLITQSTCLVVNYTDDEYDPGDPPQPGIEVKFNFQLINVEGLNERGAVSH